MTKDQLEQDAITWLVDVGYTHRYGPDIAHDGPSPGGGRATGRWCCRAASTGKRESVRAKLRLLVKRILRKYKYPPDQQDAAVELVLRQAEALATEMAC